MLGPIPGSNIGPFPDSWFRPAFGILSSPEPGLHIVLTFISRTGLKVFFLGPKPGPVIGLFLGHGTDITLFSGPEPGCLNRFILRARTGHIIKLLTGVGPRHGPLFGHVSRSGTGLYPVSRTKLCTDLFSTPEPGIQRGSFHPSEITIVRDLLFGCRPGAPPGSHIGLLL